MTITAATMIDESMRDDDAAHARLSAGRRVLARGHGLELGALARCAERFAHAQSEYGNAHGALCVAAEALRSQQRAAAEAEVDQQLTLDLLAAALVREGYAPLDPLSAFGLDSLTRLKSRSHAAKAEALLALASAVLRVRSHSERVKAAAKVVRTAARRAQLTCAPLRVLGLAVRRATRKRDALGLAWETAYCALERGARAEEEDRDRPMHSRLFGERKGPGAAKVREARRVADGRKKNAGTR